MGERSIVLRVCHHDNSSSFPVQLCQQIHHFCTILRIQITGRLIGKYQLRISNHSTSNGYTLLLTTGKLLREVFGTMTDIHSFQYIFHHPATFRSFDSQISQRQFHIFIHIQFVYQIEALEYKTQFTFTNACTLFFFQIPYFLSQKFI